MKKILLILSAAVLTLNQVNAQTPVVHFDFNNTTNDATLGLIGTPNFTPSYTTGSVQTGGSPAIQLADGNYITVPFNSALNLSSWTVSAIVRYASANSTTSLIVERYDNTRWSTDFMSTEIYNGRLYGSAANNVASWGTAPTIGTGSWNCLTITYNSATGALTTYVNGTSVNSSTWSTTYSFTGKSPTLYIGSTAGMGLIGDIDDIQIFSGALTPSQVASTCSNGLAPIGAPWLTSGNKTSAGFNIFGTLSNDDILIKTNSAQRGMITKTGFFGIGTGTSTPVRTLHVDATSNGIRFQGLPTGAQGTVKAVVADGNGDLSLATFPTGGGTGWALGGNNIASTPTTWIGTNDLYDFNIHAGGLHRGRVTKEGNLDFGNNAMLGTTVVSGAFGSNNTMTNARISFCAGENNTIRNTFYQYKPGASSGCSILGTGNTLDSSDETTVLGEDNDVFNTHGTFVGGGHNKITNTFARANKKCTLYQGIMGALDTLNDSSAYVIDQQFAYIVGAKNNIQRGHDVTVVGTSNQVDANNTVVLGSHITNTSDDAVVVGINGVRTATMTDRGMGVMVSNAANYAPGHNLEVNAQVMAGQPVASNIAFLNLPVSTRLPAVLIDPNTGELFMSKDREYTLTGDGNGPDSQIAAAIKDQQVAIKALKEQNDELKTRLAAYDQKFALLEKSIANICESGCPGLRGASNTTPSKDGAGNDKLYQSIPNPTDGKAIINYFLSRDYEQARIVIANTEGRVLQTINVSPKAGNGSASVDLGILASQTYVYTLYVNEQVVDSKKMIVIR